MTKIRAIIWDMDGTLVDSEKYYANGEIATFKEFCPEVSFETLQEYMGWTLKETAVDLVKRFNLSVTPETIIERHKEVLDKYYGEIFPAVPHAEKILAELQEKYLLGLATSAGKASAEAALERLGLLKYFVASTYGSEVSRGKPDAEIFLTTAEKLGVSVSECVVIEDSLPGFNAAKSAGMKLIARKAMHNLKQDFSLADAVVEDLLEVPGVLKNLT